MDKTKAERIARFLLAEGIKAKAQGVSAGVWEVMILGDCRGANGAEPGRYELMIGADSFSFGNVLYGDPAVFDYVEVV
jgi:hypothetical protein